jgi:hypothetical protein
MNKSLTKSLASALNMALAESGRTLQERVATYTLKVWSDTKQNEPFAIGEAEAKLLAYNAQKIATDARNKRTDANVFVDIPPTADYKHSEFKTFDNNVARLKLTIVNAQHLPKALKIVDALAIDGIVKQPELVLHKAMEAVGAGTAKTWESEKREAFQKSADKRVERESDKITPEGFTKRLKTLLDEAGKAHMALGDPGTDQEYVFKAVAPETVAHIIEKMPGDETETVLDADALAAMMNMPAFQQSLMAAFAMAAKK